MRESTRQVTLFVTDRDEPTFVPVTESVAVQPHLLDADNLREAQTLTGRLDAADGRVPLPLLRIDTTGAGFGGPAALPFSSSPRLLAGLVADAVAVGVAAGAVVRVSGAPLQLRTEIAAYLEKSGYVVALDVPGWVLADAHADMREAS